MGPVAYLLNASDLRPIDQNNIIFKYADDTYLIVPDSNIQKPLQWRCNIFLSGQCATIISLLKTHIPAATQLTRLESLKVLGVTFNTKLSFEPHISYIIQSAASSFYGLKTLRAYGLTGKSLKDDTQATLIKGSCMLYLHGGILKCCGEGPHRVRYQKRQALRLATKRF